jgi:hypothetical protein
MYPDGYILKAVKKVVAEKQKVCDVSKATSGKSLFYPTNFLLYFTYLIHFTLLNLVK